MKKAMLVVLALVIGSSVFAHEGHDKTPGAVAAPHGGAVQGTENLYWELVKEAGGVKLYALTHDLAPISPKDIILEGKVSFPKMKGKPETVKFSTEGESFSAKIDAKGAYRYTLDLVSTYKGKKEKVKFQVEPQS